MERRWDAWDRRDGSKRGAARCSIPLTIREFIELRVLRDRFAEFFRPDEGEFLGELVFKVLLPTDDPHYEQILQRKAELLSRGELLFAGWNFVRRYSPDELRNASAFHLSIERAFEPVGEECGTVYD